MYTMRIALWLWGHGYTDWCAMHFQVGVVPKSSPAFLSVIYNITQSIAHSLYYYYSYNVCHHARQLGSCKIVRTSNIQNARLYFQKGTLSVIWFHQMLTIPPYSTGHQRTHKRLFRYQMPFISCAKWWNGEQLKASFCWKLFYKKMSLLIKLDNMIYIAMT